MNDTKNTGGSAFPVIGQSEATTVVHQPGMTLRDYFAAKAMNQMIPGILRTGDESTADDTARWAYVFADAMLKAREQ